MKPHHTLTQASPHPTKPESNGGAGYGASGLGMEYVEWRLEREGALWCHIITLLCAAGDWISGWGEDGEEDGEEGGSSSISSAKILSRRDIRAPKVESFSLAAAAAASLLPSFCLPFWRTLLAPPRSRCGLADLTSRGNIAPASSLMSVQKISVRSRREGRQSCIQQWIPDRGGGGPLSQDIKNIHKCKHSGHVYWEAVLP